MALTRRFGELLRVPYVKHLDEHPDIIAVLKEADEMRKREAFSCAVTSEQYRAIALTAGCSTK